MHLLRFRNHNSFFYTNRRKVPFVIFVPCQTVLFLVVLVLCFGQFVL